jgi:hypothetical protein
MWGDRPQPDRLAGVPFHPPPPSQQLDGQPDLPYLPRVHVCTLCTALSSREALDVFTSLPHLVTCL